MVAKLWNMCFLVELKAVEAICALDDPLLSGRRRHVLLGTVENRCMLQAKLKRLLREILKEMGSDTFGLHLFVQRRAEPCNPSSGAYYYCSVVLPY